MDETKPFGTSKRVVWEAYRRVKDNRGAALVTWGAFSRLNDGSRMNGDVHVRFCEGLGVKFPRATLPARSGRGKLRYRV